MFCLRHRNRPEEHFFAYLLFFVHRSQSKPRNNQTNECNREREAGKLKLEEVKTAITTCYGTEGSKILIQKGGLI